MHAKLVWNLTNFSVARWSQRLMFVGIPIWKLGWALSTRAFTWSFPTAYENHLPRGESVVSFLFQLDAEQGAAGGLTMTGVIRKLTSSWTFGHSNDVRRINLQSFRRLTGWADSVGLSVAKTCSIDIPISFPKIFQFVIMAGWHYWSFWTSTISSVIRFPMTILCIIWHHIALGMMPPFWVQTCCHSAVLALPKTSAVRYMQT